MTLNMAGIQGDEHNVTETKRKLINLWIEYLADWFPDLDTKTYFVPPLHVNTLKVEQYSVQYEPCSDDSSNDNLDESHAHVFQMKETSLSDTRDDRAHLLVLHKLWNFSKLRIPEEVMVVLSRYQVSNYMTKTLEGKILRTRKRKVKTRDVIPSKYFPVPNVDGDRSIRRGDFDFLIIHKSHGLIVVEVKAIGDLDIVDAFQEKFSRKFEKSLFQLNKLEETLTFILSDIHVRPSIPITKVLALPNMSREMLRKVMTHTRDYQGERLKQCLNATSFEDALAMCFCKDEVMDTSMTTMITWWESITRNGRPGHSLTEDLYKELIARFCGPVSTVSVWSPWHRKDKVCEVRTISEATVEMENRYTMRILRRKQLNLLHLDKRLVYLTGPPRSGKTLILLLKAIRWAEEGDTLVVVRAGGNNPGHFISHVLYNQIIHTMALHGLKDNDVHMETVNANTNPEMFVRRMKTDFQVQGRKLRLLIDELWVVDLSAKLPPLIKEIMTSQEKAIIRLKKVSKAVGINSEVNEILLKNIKTYVDEIIEKLKSFNFTHILARKLLTEKIQHLISQLKANLGRILNALKFDDNLELRDENQADASDLEEVLEILENTNFYVDVISSWMASPIMKDITRIVAEDKSEITLWCTGFWPRMCPPNYHMEMFEFCIGCPPHVQRIMKMTETLASHHDEIQYRYITNSTEINPPLPAEGELYHLLNHGLHMKEGDNVMEVSDCHLCGNNLADLLLDTLNVGKPDQNQSRGNPDQLQFRDVLIVGRELLPMKPTSLFLKQLKERKIDFSVVKNGTNDLFPDLSVNHVLVTNTFHGHGLERAIVVFVPVIRKCPPYDTTSETNSLNKTGHNIANISAMKREDNSGSRPVTAIYTTSTAASVEEEEWMERLGEYNRRGLWFVASRSAADLVIFHV